MAQLHLEDYHHGLKLRNRWETYHTAVAVAIVQVFVLHLAMATAKVLAQIAARVHAKRTVPHPAEAVVDKDAKMGANKVALVAAQVLAKVVAVKTALGLAIMGVKNVALGHVRIIVQVGVETCV